MTRLLVANVFLDKLTLPQSYGGLACSDAQANYLLPRIVEMVAPLISNEKVILGEVPPELLTPVVLSITREVLPTVKLLIAEVRVEYIALSKQLLSVGCTDIEEAYKRGMATGHLHGYNLRR